MSTYFDGIQINEGEVIERLDVCPTGQIITTTKGDLLVDTGGRTERVGIGSSGQILRVNTNATSCIEWSNLYETQTSVGTTQVDINTTSYIAAIPDMIITVNTSGTYQVQFSSYGRRVGGSNIFSFYSIFLNTTQITESERIYRSAAGHRHAIYTQTVIFAQAGDLIQVGARVSSSASNFRVENRSLHITRVE